MSRLTDVAIDTLANVADELALIACAVQVTRSAEDTIDGALDRRAEVCKRLGEARVAVVALRSVLVRERESADVRTSVEVVKGVHQLPDLNRMRALEARVRAMTKPSRTCSRPTTDNGSSSSVLGTWTTTWRADL